MVSETGFLSRLTLFLLVFFGLVTIASVFLFNPTYSGITYTTSLYKTQSLWQGALTGLSDLNFFFFGRFAYLVPVFLTLMHILFLFQRTRKGFNWLRWLGFILATGILFWGLGLIYASTQTSEYRLFNIYNMGGFFATLVSYFVSEILIKFLLGLALVLLGVFAMYQFMIKRLIADYYAFLQADKEANLEGYQDSSISSSILEESQRRRQEKEEQRSKEYPFFNLPGISAQDKLEQLQSEVDSIASLATSLDVLPRLTPAQQQTQDYLIRLYETKYQEFIKLRKELGKKKFTGILRMIVSSGYSPTLSQISLPYSPIDRENVKISQLIPLGQEDNYVPITYAEESLGQEYVSEQGEGEQVIEQVGREEATEYAAEPSTAQEDRVGSLWEEFHSLEQDIKKPSQEEQVLSTAQEPQQEPTLTTAQEPQAEQTFATAQEPQAEPALAIAQEPQAEPTPSSEPAREEQVQEQATPAPAKQKPAGKGKSKKGQKATGYYNISYEKGNSILAAKKAELAQKEAILEKLKALKEQSSSSK
ncbi:hypothetical protein CJP74_01430 [Psittacicella melopsittaci]|uniref:DNA translocase FtsK n=1 Tax=Psittacicella melopsittaci TaxID=2028576 RepID=A0A3A1YBG0_9GAMM|nr:hypothetical protein [Psittacicella melopsittaci]RIY33554.1 hypothetical protein CJP74_01430 [Psittacicella melopsittaci]